MGSGGRRGGAGHRHRNGYRRLVDAAQVEAVGVAVGAPAAVQAVLVGAGLHGGGQGEVAFRGGAGDLDHLDAVDGGRARAAGVGHQHAGGAAGVAVDHQLVGGAGVAAQGGVDPHQAVGAGVVAVDGERVAGGAGGVAQVQQARVVQVAGEGEGRLAHEHAAGGLDEQAHRCAAGVGAAAHGQRCAGQGQAGVVQGDGFPVAQGVAACGGGHALQGELVDPAVGGRDVVAAVQDGAAVVGGGGHQGGVRAVLAVEAAREGAAGPGEAVVAVGRAGGAVVAVDVAAEAAAGERQAVVAQAEDGVAGDGAGGGDDCVAAEGVGAGLSRVAVADGDAGGGAVDHCGCADVDGAACCGQSVDGRALAAAAGQAAAGDVDLVGARVRRGAQAIGIETGGGRGATRDGGLCQTGAEVLAVHAVSVGARGADGAARQRCRGGGRARPKCRGAHKLRSHRPLRSRCCRPSWTRSRLPRHRPPCTNQCHPLPWRPLLHPSARKWRRRTLW